MKYKAISLWEPWASLISLGLKKYETRSWRTNYRGKLVICSAKKRTKQQQEQYFNLSQKYQLNLCWHDLPFGSAIAICDLTDCIEMTDKWIQTISQTERECGDWQVGRYAWQLDKIEILDNPIAVKGKQGLWNVEEIGARKMSEQFSLFEPEEDNGSASLIDPIFDKKASLRNSISDKK